MPNYQFECRKCKESYEELVSYDETGKYKGVKCPNCNSKSKKQTFNYNICCAFDKPKESSKWDNEGYRWGHNKEKAQQERRDAEAKSHMGNNPYPNIS